MRELRILITALSESKFPTHYKSGRRRSWLRSSSQPLQIKSRRRRELRYHHSSSLTQFQSIADHKEEGGTI